MSAPSSLRDLCPKFAHRRTPTAPQPRMHACRLTSVRRFNSPGARVPTSRFASGESSSMRSTSSTCASRCAGVTSASRRSVAEKVSASRTVVVGMWRSSCSEKPEIRAKEKGEISWPFTRLVPPTTPLVLRLARTSRSVVFPAPLAPISAVMVPGLQGRRGWIRCGVHAGGSDAHKHSKREGRGVQRSGSSLSSKASTWQLSAALSVLFRHNTEDTRWQSLHSPAYG